MKKSQIKQTKEDKKRLKELEKTVHKPKMSQTPAKQAQLRNERIYISELLRKGWSNRTIVVHLVEKFGINEDTANLHIKQAIEWLATYNDGEWIKDIRSKQMERLEAILEEAVANHNIATANKILDTINKLYGLYETKQKVEITSNEIQFKFGGVDNNEENEDVSE